MLKVIPKKHSGCSVPVWRRQRPFGSLLACLGLASLAVGWSLTATAGDHVYNFDPPNGDPNAIPGFVLFGANVPNAWHTNNGASGSDTDGFLEITPAANGENLGVLFPVDYFTNADQSLVPLPLKGFLVEADVRIGDATGNNGRPADGFSINFADQFDPVVYWGSQGNFRGWAGGDSNPQALEPQSFNYANGTGAMDPGPCDAGNGENGTKTGVAVEFDTWAGNIVLDENGVPGADNVGWRVHYAGKLLQRINVSQIPASPDGSPGDNLNGLDVCPAYNSTFDQDPSCTALVCTDVNTIQTGTYNSTNGGSVDTLCWTHFSIELTTNEPHQLTVIFKGRTLIDHFTLTNFSPFVGRLIMGGRTGGANENRDVDNVHIVTYPSVQAIFNGVTSSSSFITDFTLNLANIGPATVTTISKLTLDGVDITASPQTKLTIGAPYSTATFTSTTNFAAGSVHQAAITFSDAIGNVQTSTIGFTVLPWTILPAAMAVPDASVDTGFLNSGVAIKAHQSLVGNATRNYWSDEQLMGLHGTNIIDFTSVNNYDPTTGNIGWNGVVNFNKDVTAGSGEFPTTGPDGNPILFDALGIAGVNAPTNGLYNNIVVSYSTYIHFPTAGTYVMGGNSDDGLRVTFAKNAQDLLGSEIPGLNADTGRGIGRDQNVGAVIIPQAGYYGCRLLYYNGGGGAGIEWYLKANPATNANILINDVLNYPVPQTVATYQVSSAAPPYVSYAEPPLDDNQVRADATLKYQLTDASTTVNSGTVVLKINGTTQSPTVSNSGGVTTITQPPPAALWTQGTNTVELSFKDSANTSYDYNYIFVVQSFVTLDPSMSVALGKQDSTKPGFVLHVVQFDFGQVGQTGFGMPNQSDNAIGAVAGLFFPYFGSNIANIGNTFSTNVPATSGNEWDWTGTILWNAAGPADSIGDYPRASYKIVPGIPGAFVAGNTGNDHNNFAVQMQTWVAFPTAGLYGMDFNSDDGFRVWEGWGPTRQVLHVSNGSNIDMDVGVTVSSTQNGNPGYAPPPPAVPITAPVVLVGSNTALSSVSGKIVVAPTGLFGLSSGPLTYFMQTNGAVAVVLLNASFPGVNTATPPGKVTIPSLRAASFNGSDAWSTNANLTASIGASQGLVLGEADYGKGRSEITSSFYVPQAGVYPITAIYYQGGGGAGAEWTTITADGNRHLLNDTTDPAAFLTYRAASTPTNNPTISIGQSGGKWVITYTGILYSSSTVNGSYTAVGGAVSPYTVPSNTGIQFYRAHQ
jgi:hypothetical protein